MEYGEIDRHLTETQYLKERGTFILEKHSQGVTNVWDRWQSRQKKRTILQAERFLNNSFASGDMLFCNFV